MKENSTISKRKINRMKIIFNDDLAILDYLADMQDRKIIKELQRFVDDSKGGIPGCLLLNCPSDNMVVLILNNSPFGFNEGDNNLIMYADNNLTDLIKYFKNQLDHTSEDIGAIYKALDDITRYLYFTWVNDEDSNTQTNFMG